MQSNYYQKTMLDYVVKESDPLFNRFEEKGNNFSFNGLMFYF